MSRVDPVRPRGRILRRVPRVPRGCSHGPRPSSWSPSSGAGAACSRWASAPASSRSRCTERYPMRGLDISAPMVGKLVEKADGRPFPLVIGGRDRPAVRGRGRRRGLDAVGASPDAGLAGRGGGARPCGPPGGVLVANASSVYGGPWEEVRRRFEQMVGVPTEPVGIGWHREEELDAEVARHGGRLRLLPHLAGRGEERLADLLDGVEQEPLLVDVAGPRRCPQGGRRRAPPVGAQGALRPARSPSDARTTMRVATYDLPAYRPPPGV